MNTDLIQKKVAGEKWRVYTTIDGNRCSPTQRVGYCWSETHRGYLTLPLMREHECIEKGCKHFQKYEQAPYWKEKEKNKAAKKEARALAKHQETQEQRILELIREETKDDPDFYAISAARDGYRYIVRFVRFAWLDIDDYVQRMKAVCGVPIYLQEIKNTYEHKLRILEAQGMKREV